MKEHIIERLRIAILHELEDKNQGYTTFADLCGISRKIMGDIVNDRKTDLKLSTIVKICENSDIRMEDIFCEEEFNFEKEDFTVIFRNSRFKIKFLQCT